MTQTRTPFPGSLSQRSASSSGDEASGLIDIRTLGALVGATDARAEVPSFAGLTISPTLAPSQPELVRPVTERHAAVPRSQTPLFALLGALALGVVGLAGFVISQPPPQAQVAEVRIIPIAAPEREADEREEVRPKAKVDAVAEVAAVEPDKVAGKERKQPRRQAAGVQDKPGEPSKLAAVVDAPKPAEKEKVDYGVDCILGKTACGDKSVNRPADVEGPAVVVPSNLPEKLEQADISAGTSAARAAATSACAGLAKGGEKVQIKLSIAGATGTVVGASAVEDAGNPQLAACCVGELKQASFRKVQKQQTGTVVTVKF